MLNYIDKMQHLVYSDKEVNVCPIWVIILKQKRIQAGLSYKELSIMTGISDTSLQRMETGKTGMPRWENLCSIAKALGFHPFEIMQTAGYILKKT